MKVARTLLCLLPACASAADVSALHPRIYVRHDDAKLGIGITVSQLRERSRSPVLARWRREVPARGVAAIVERAARYLEDGNPEDLAAVREFLSTHTFSYAKHDVGGYLAGGEMATAYDWVHHGLSESERAAIMANIVTTAESSRKFLRSGEVNHNYTYMALTTVAVCGLVLKGEPEPYHAKGEEYLEVARQWIESPGKVLDTWNAREGAWSEGSHYTFHETFRNLVWMFAAYRSASDIDYFERIEREHGDFLVKAGRFLIGSTRPDMTFIRTGDSSSSRVQANITVPVTMEMFAAGVGDTAEAARFRSFADALRKAYGDDAVHPVFGWGMRIFLDLRASRSPSYKTHPLVARFGAGTYDQIVFRNGWEEDSTHIAILAGDHFTDHQHFDKGHFLIYHRGGLNVDGGVYDGMYKRGGHSGEYAPRTIAHNCVLVYDPNQVFPGGYTNDGGQNILRGIQHHRDWPTFVAHRQKERLDTAEVTAYDHQQDRYGYVRVNLTSAYGDKVSFYDRQFVYLPSQDFLVIFDRVTAAQPGFKKRWVLHFQGRPTIDGRIPEPGVQEFPGASSAVARRSGELNLGGRTFSYDGVLFVKTLAPENPRVLAVGGPGFEYFNTFNETNYPPRPGRVAEVREPGQWRIEVAPEGENADDQFLHTLQMAGPSVKQPVESRAVGGVPGKLSGVQFLSSPQNQVVLFSADSKGATVTLPAAYEISSGQQGDHVLTELPPSTDVVVEINGKRIQSRTNAGGILTFSDRARGRRKIAIRLK
jgi:hypothetical protein